MSIWMAENLYLWDMGHSSGVPHWIGCTIDSIAFGPDGTIEIWGYLPGSNYLHDMPAEGVHVQVVSNVCGRSDVYANAEGIVAELKDGTSTKYIDLSAGNPVILRISLRGHVTPGSEKGEHSE